MEIIQDVSLDEERALYGKHDLLVKNVKFDGIADGESALKECSNIQVENCYCNLRYPFWHIDGLKITDTELTSLCRAAIWYSKNIYILGTKMHGIKALRECEDVKIANCDIISPEFGWSVSNIEMKNCTVDSQYFMLRSKEIKVENITFRGKYSFQYIENAKFTNCIFNTKDAFWHGKNIIVKDSIINGEYLAWYTENITLINCTISGTQPFCYCRGLKMINCKMENTDLCFEKSEVVAEISTHIISIKNPRSGKIILPSVGKLIYDDDMAKGVVVITDKQS